MIGQSLKSLPSIFVYWGTVRLIRWTLSARLKSNKSNQTQEHGVLYKTIPPNSLQKIDCLCKWLILLWAKSRLYGYPQRTFFSSEWSTRSSSDLQSPRTKICGARHSAGPKSWWFVKDTRSEKSPRSWYNSLEPLSIFWKLFVKMVDLRFGKWWESEE